MLGQGWTLAHIVGMRPPGVLSWVAAAALFGGLFAMLLRGGRIRMACGVLALAGLAGTLYDWKLRGDRPARPDLVIQLVSPRARTTAPVVVQVCARTTHGTRVSATADGRFLLVRVDGGQVAEMHGDTVAIPLAHGRHDLSVEITSPDHQEFNPLLRLQRWVTVIGAGPPQAVLCPT